GTATHDTASLGGKVGSFSLNSTSTVNYVLFTSHDCGTGGGSPETVNVTAGETVPDATAQTLGAGTYSYQATYNGNTNYNSKTGAYQPSTLPKGTPTISTVLKDDASPANTVSDGSPAALGTATHDTSTLGGKVGSFSLNGTATVSYVLFTSHDCLTGGGSPRALSSFATRRSSDLTAQTLGAGTYSYQATYNGNTNYNSK